MITRRAFLSALSALPFVGKLIPQETITRADVFYGWPPVIPTNANGGEKVFLVFDNNAYEFVMREPRGETSPHLTFAEWDRLHQV